MNASIRRLPIALVPVLVVLAVLGFVVGHGRSGAAPAELTRTFSAAGVQLNYPSDWQRTGAAPAIAGLSIAHPAVLAPNGNAAHGGLLIGQLPAGEPSPLPRAFMARMRALPDVKIVDLLEVQAFRYAGLSIPGVDRMLTVFAIPSPGASPRVLVCYASSGYSGLMPTCEQIAATLTLAGQSQSYDLTPDPGFAHKLGASIKLLDDQRLSLRGEMGPGAVPATVHRFATRLAASFAIAAASLSVLEPPAVARQAQTTLSGSVLRARDAYTALAAAASSENPASFNAARTQVYQAEAGVNAVLESFALLGYKQA